MRIGGTTPLSALAVAALALLCITMLSSIADAHPSHPSHAAQTAARAEAAVRDAAALERRESLAHALSELNHIAAMPWPGAPDSHVAHPPVYALHAVHSYSVHATQGDLIRRVPVYRTVRGYDEKKRRPVLYQTLVHEEQLQRVVVDRSATMHLVLRRRSPDELAAAARDRAADRAHECVASEEPSCAPAQQPDPSTLLHALLTVATDYEGHRATTMLRSASVEEVASWWGAFLAREHGEQHAHGDRTTSAVYAAAQDAYLRAHASYLRPIHARLQGQPPYDGSLDAGAGSITAMSVNIWNFNHWQHRQEMLGEVVRAAAPDLIGFQEVRALKSAPASHAHPGNRWQVADLARLFPGMEYAYQAAMGFREGRGEFVHEGLAVFSRWPVALTAAVRLTRDGQDGEDFHQRLCLRARVGTPWGPVNFLTTHLSLSRGARLRTLPEVGAVANALLPEPSLVVGDFNAPYSEGPHVLAADPFRFRDAWQRVHGKDEGKDELARRKGFTFHSWDHRSRIDFVFYNSRLEQGDDSSGDDGGGHPTIPSLHPTSIEVLGSEGRSIAHAPLPPVGGVEDMRDTLFPSDHLFLAAKFRVTHNRAQAATTTTVAHPAAAASSTAASGVAAPGELKDEL